MYGGLLLQFTPFPAVITSLIDEYAALEIHYFNSKKPNFSQNRNFIHCDAMLAELREWGLIHQDPLVMAITDGGKYNPETAQWEEHDIYGFSVCIEALDGFKWPSVPFDFWFQINIFKPRFLSPKPTKKKITHKTRGIKRSLNSS